jgi:signal transduction histidine kinase
MVADTEPIRGRGGLSRRLLLLTIGFVLVGEILIFLPSVARFRHEFLRQRIAESHIAALAAEAAPNAFVGADLEQRLVDYAGVLAITLQRPTGSELMLGRLVFTERTYDLRADEMRERLALIGDALAVLWRFAGGAPLPPIRVIDSSPHDPAVLVDVTLEERPLARAMFDYGLRILALSIVLSLLVALLIYVSLRWLIIRPLRRITERVAMFRAKPEAAVDRLPDEARNDEIGVVEREIGRMQREIRAALAQKTRLAALGEAVGKINHDLRNMLASAVLLSDRLETSQDPEVRQIAPRLMQSLDRAVRLCAATRDERIEPKRERLSLRQLVEEVGEEVVVPSAKAVWRNDVPPDLFVEADRELLFRALLNVLRNAEQAITTSCKPGLVSAAAWGTARGVMLEIADTGPGVPEALRERLFQPFAASTTTGGSGLGLSIAREILKAHGGDVGLERTGPDGTVMCLLIP